MVSDTGISETVLGRAPPDATTATLSPLGNTASWVPVMARIEYGCGAAFAAAVRCTVSENGLLTVTVPTVTPGIGLIFVIPCTKLVLTPVTLKIPDVPTASVDGLIDEITGVPCGSNWLKAPRMIKIAKSPRITGLPGQ